MQMKATLQSGFKKWDNLPLTIPFSAAPIAAG